MGLVASEYIIITVNYDLSLLTTPIVRHRCMSCSLFNKKNDEYDDSTSRCHFISENMTTCYGDKTSPATVLLVSQTDDCKMPVAFEEIEGINCNSD